MMASKSKRKRRKWYEVREVVIYRVFAHSEKEAEALVADNRDKLVAEVTDRDDYLAD